MKKLITISLAVLGSYSLMGQDIHFSQFFHSPLNQNPALTGNFEGDFRGIANYRTQWRSISTGPYVTMAIGGDARGFSPKLPGLHGGLALYHDKAGDSKFKTNVGNINAAYEFYPSGDSAHRVMTGIQLGLTGRNIDYAALSYNNQYNGSSYDPSLPSRENFVLDSRTYANLNFGVAYKWEPEHRKSVTAGLAFHDITAPKQSFYDDIAIKLDRRITLHAMANYPLNGELDLQPGLQLMQQGKYTELIIGSNAKYRLNGAQSVIGGVWYRNIDAFYLMAGFQQDNIIGAISYDINISRLVPASNMRGALEIGIIYILKRYKPKFQRYRTCPNYI